MAEYNLHKNGEICWFELATNNLQAAKEFYSELFGWEFKQSAASTDKEYSEIYTGGIPVGGMMEMDEKWGPTPPPPYWSTYVAVDDINDTIAKIEANGGSVRMAPFEAPGVGTIAVVADPSGATFEIIKLSEHA